MACDYDTIPVMEKMHETTERLFAAVDELEPGQAITSAIARRINVGDNLVTNWKDPARGVSFKGAVLAEASFGIPAAWIMFGEHPPIQNTWPFSAWIAFDRIRALSPADLTFLAGKLDAALSDLESRSR